MYFLSPFFIATTPPKDGDEQLRRLTSDIFRAIETSTLDILILCDFVN
jgi:hypothetical protein